MYNNKHYTYVIISILIANSNLLNLLSTFDFCDTFVNLNVAAWFLHRFKIGVIHSLNDTYNLHFTFPVFYVLDKISTFYVPRKFIFRSQKNFNPTCVKNLYIILFKEVIKNWGRRYPVYSLKLSYRGILLKDRAYSRHAAEKLLI